MWSQIVSSRPIGGKLARQIEQHYGKPLGWLNEERLVEAPSAPQQQFLALALTAWRASNSAGRKVLRAPQRGHWHFVTLISGSVSTCRFGLGNPRIGELFTRSRPTLPARLHESRPRTLHRPLRMHAPLRHDKIGIPPERTGPSFTVRNHGHESVRGMKEG
jgi:hypothetical protein